MALTWMQSGAQSAALAQKEAAEAEKRKSEQGKMFRFWLKEGETDVPITFVDGDLSPEGFLLPPRYYEHQIYLNGSWTNWFVCPEKTNPGSGEKCPFCESGDKAQLVAVFTVIDHRTYQSKDKTKSYSNTRKLLVAKANTFELLNNIAKKRKGLAGARFDVSRIGDKSPSVGSNFDFMGKEDIADLEAKYTRTYKTEDGKDKTETIFKPADYENEIVYRNSAELRQLGFGHPASPQAGSGTPIDYSSQL